MSNQNPNTNQSRQGSSFLKGSADSCCAPHSAAPTLFLPPTCGGTIPPYAGTINFGNAMWQNGSPQRASLNQLSSEFDQSSRQMFNATFNVAGNYWSALVVPASAADTLQGQKYGFIGVQITSSDSRKLITNITISAYDGSVVNAAPAPVLRNKVSHDSVTQTGSTNMYAILPLLASETSSQRTLLSATTLLFTAAATKDGIEVRVDGLANDPAYSVRAFVMNRGIAVCDRYALALGV